MAFLHSVSRYKWVIVIAAVGCFLFYWYEIRPITLYRYCATQASADARKLLKSKADLSKGTEQGKSYDQLIAKNMYLRTDYESFLNKCLLYYGLEKPTVTQPNPDAAAAAKTSSAAAIAKKK